jgi:chromosome segregation ATPase
MVLGEAMSDEADKKAAEIVKQLAAVVAQFGALAQPVSNQIIAAALRETPQADHWHRLADEFYKQWKTVEAELESARAETERVRSQSDDVLTKLDRQVVDLQAEIERLEREIFRLRNDVEP